MYGYVWVMAQSPHDHSASVGFALHKRQVRIKFISRVQAPLVFSLERLHHHVEVMLEYLGFSYKDEVGFDVVCEVFEVKDVSKQTFQVPS